MTIDELDANQALLLGGIWGAVMGLERDERIPTKIELIQDEGPSFIRITRESGSYRLELTREESDGS